MFGNHFISTRNRTFVDIYLHFPSSFGDEWSVDGDTDNGSAYGNHILYSHQKQNMEDPHFEPSYGFDVVENIK